MQTVNSCGDWTATFFPEPSGPNRLKVHGECTFPTPGYKVELKRREPQGINPQILMLDHIVVPPTGIEPQRVDTVVVRYEERTSVRYHEVQIFPAATRISVKEARTAEVGQAAAHSR
jgi:hypothetical protein